MPDISKCLNEDCPIKQDCYRYTSKPSFRQSYTNFTYDKDKGCEHYLYNQ